MRLSKTIRRLRRAGKAAASLVPTAVSSRLTELKVVKDNPGDLHAYCYVPEGLEAGAPLVVVLHGCTQNAAGYDRGSGWSKLAERQGFALLFPEQTRSNNPNLCFNWYSASDSRRGEGEAASIRAMVEEMCKRHGIDRSRIFVTGLSAGGAMASAMLATYPELFAGGAIIAGIPYGCASGVMEAFECMGGRTQAETADLAASVRHASQHRGPWPRVSIWHGSEDRTVAPSNGDAIVRQWAALHGLPPQPNLVEQVAGYPRRVWVGPDGREVIEHYEITGMAHGTPLMPGTSEGRSGEAMPHMLDVGLSSTDRIAAFFGIAPAAAVAAEKKAPKEKTAPRAAPRPRPKAQSQAQPASGVQKVIEDALRTAGLMR